MTQKTATRGDVLREARSWVGTPYHNCADIKGVGVDCGMLLVRVYCDLGLCPPFDPRPYTHDWHLHRSEEIYLTRLLAHARRITAPLAGDVALMRVGRCYSHGGIITNLKPFAMVHASCPAQIVLEEEIERNGEMAERMGTMIFASVFCDAASGAFPSNEMK